jgi:hypothetical protein
MLLEAKFDRWMPRVNRGLSGPTIARARLPTSGDKNARHGHRYPALSGLEEFDGDLFALDVGQLVRTEQNRKGFGLG